MKKSTFGPFYRQMGELKLPDLKTRRSRFAKAVGNAPVLIGAGSDRPRNYLQNPYRFRAGSHFLYLVGLPLKDALLLWDGSKYTLYFDDPPADHDVWSGAMPVRSEIESWVGLKSKALSKISGDLSKLKRRTLTLAPPEPIQAAKMCAWLGRPFIVDKLGFGLLESIDYPAIDAMAELRLRHDSMSLSSMRRAIKTSRDAFVAAKKATRAGAMESDVLSAVLGTYAQAEMDPAYNPIVTVHGEILHAEHYPNTLKRGDLLLMDAGAESYLGQSTDVTRVWPVSGKLSSTQSALYNLVLNMQRSAIALCKPGMRYREIHLAAARTLVSGLKEIGIFRGSESSILEQGLHATFFPHGVGHLLGLDTHDLKDLGDRIAYPLNRKRSSQFGLNYLRMDRDLVDGQTVTIEPGFYQIPVLRERNKRALKPFLNESELKKFSDVRGIRIEDDVLITRSGYEVLTREIPK